MRLIENTREHDIHIQVGDVSVMVPAATMQPQADGPAQKVNGWAQIEASDLEKSQKSAVVAYYFAEGWLVDSGDVAGEETSTEETGDVAGEETSTEETPVRRKKGE